MTASASTLPNPPINPWARALTEHRLSYPDVHVVRFLSAAARTVKSEPRRGLDVGFGSGQHLQTLAEFGYETWGTELLADEVERLGASLAPHLRGGRLLHGHLGELPELREKFDVAVAWGVACLNRPSHLVSWLSGLGDVLRPGGRACLNFRTPDNWFNALGTLLEPKCYQLDERAGPYAGATYSFLNEADVRNALCASGFAIDNFERDDWWKNNLRERHSWWIVWVRKGGS